jgi:hypothetical protein
MGLTWGLVCDTHVPNMLNRFKINATKAEMTDIWLKWLKEDSDQRFGQWFYNNYCEGDPWPLLFHETNDMDAYSLAYMRIKE